jgi:hypothetical protein
MLVTFSCREYENITMFGEIAKRLLILMGHSATIPGAILADDIPEALSRLKKEIAQDQQRTNTMNHHQHEDEDELVSLAHRAFPLINMLEAASKKKSNIMWK